MNEYTKRVKSSRALIKSFTRVVLSKSKIFGTAASDYASFTLFGSRHVILRYAWHLYLAQSSLIVPLLSTKLDYRSDLSYVSLAAFQL